MQISAEKLVDDFARNGDHGCGLARHLDRRRPRTPGDDAKFAEDSARPAVAQDHKAIVAVDPGLGFAAHQHEHRIGALASAANSIAGEEGFPVRAPRDVGKRAEFQCGEHVNDEEFRHDDSGIGASASPHTGKQIVDQRGWRFSPRRKCRGDSSGIPGIGSGKRRDRERSDDEVAVAGELSEDLVGGVRCLDDVDIRKERGIGSHFLKGTTHLVRQPFDRFGDSRIGFFADQGVDRLGKRAGDAVLANRSDKTDQLANEELFPQKMN